MKESHKASNLYDKNGNHISVSVFYISSSSPGALSKCVQLI